MRVIWWMASTNPASPFCVASRSYRFSVSVGYHLAIEVCCPDSEQCVIHQHVGDAAFYWANAATFGDLISLTHSGLHQGFKGSSTFAKNLLCSFNFVSQHQ